MILRVRGRRRDSRTVKLAMLSCRPTGRQGRRPGNRRIRRKCGEKNRPRGVPAAPSRSRETIVPWRPRSSATGALRRSWVGGSPGVREAVHWDSYAVREVPATQVRLCFARPVSTRRPAAANAAERPAAVPREYALRARRARGRDRRGVCGAASGRRRRRNRRSWKRSPAVSRALLLLKRFNHLLLNHIAAGLIDRMRDVGVELCSAVVFANRLAAQVRAALIAVAGLQMVLRTALVAMCRQPAARHGDERAVAPPMIFKSRMTKQ